MRKWIKEYWGLCIGVILTILIVIAGIDIISELPSEEDKAKWDKDYIIQSIRVDDDAEYHIVAVSSTGVVKTISDADQGYDIKLRYSNTSKPILRYHLEEISHNRSRNERIPDVILPFGYDIETFDD